MSEGREARPLRILDRLMASTALASLSLLILRHGMQFGEGYDGLIGVGNTLFVLVFAVAQAAKLLVVPDPADYYRRHRLDFALLFVLAIQLIAYAGLRSTAEFDWLERQGIESPLWPLIVVSVQVYMVAIVALRSTVVHRLLVLLRLRPVQILVVSFALLIALGTLLLAMPGAAADGRAASLLDAFFTATSAVCVTGLVVWDTGTHFSGLGLTVLLFLIQAGGLGMLTITGSFALFGGKEMADHDTHAITKVMKVGSVQEAEQLLRRVLVATFVFEALGALALFVAWGGVIPETLERVGWSVFHAVSAFCNAGFALFPANASLTGASGTTVALAAIAALIVAGGIGFAVLDEFVKRWIARLLRREVPPLSSHARWTLAATVTLLVLGTVLFWVTEREGVLRSFEGFESWVQAGFQSVTLRTAGFNSVDLAALGLPSVLLCIVWMLVGGAPGGTAGGMKVTTAAVVVASPFRRLLPDAPLRRRALLLAAFFVGQYVVVTALLALVQQRLDGRLAFEVASALGTVGLSMGETAELGTAGKLILCAAMFAGRVGPFALAASLLARLEHAAAQASPPGSIQLG